MGDRRPDTVDVAAAGALLWRTVAGSLSIGLIHRPRYDDWSLPKGKLDPGEPAPVAAAREVAEETGIDVALGRPLPAQVYCISDGRTKRVDYWAAHVDDGAAFVPNDEADDFRWCTPAEAGECLTYPRDREVLHAFLADAAPTAALILLRHADALSRSDWLGTDRDRPLTGAGSAQAERVRALLTCRGVSGLISSPARRCLDTLGPFVDWDTDSMTTVEWLAEEEFDDARVTAAAGTLLARLPVPPRAAVVCGHQPVLTELAVALGVPREAAPLPTAGMWVLHVAAGRVVASERVAQER